MQWLDKRLDLHKPILVCLSLFTAGGGRGDNEPLVLVPTPNQLFQELSYDLTSTDRPYVLSDRFSGVYAGTSRSSSGFYSVEEVDVLGDFQFAHQGQLIERASAQSFLLFPYGVRAVFAQAEASWMLLHNENGMLLDLIPRFQGELVSVRLTSPLPLLTSAYEKEARTQALPAGLNAEIFWSQQVSPNAPHMAVITDGQFEDIGSSSRRRTEGGPEPLVFSVASRTEHLRAVLLVDANPTRLQQRINQHAAAFAQAERATINAAYDRITRSYVHTGNADFNKALAWSVVSGSSFLNKRFGSLGLFAGFPWFQQDWGRDTFISLPGISIFTGYFEEAKDIIRSFASRQNLDKTSSDLGRIPNRVKEGETIYNTVDATPWMFRAAWELIKYTGDVEFASEILGPARLALEGALTHHVDERAFLTHAAADTWMDAKIDGTYPWSPRDNRAVEIQALWYNQLRITAELERLSGNPSGERKIHALAEQLRQAFFPAFWNPRTEMLYDRLTAKGEPDARVRPNQLLALTSVQFQPLVSSNHAATLVHSALSRLMFPYGVASLSPNDLYFHPYHESWENYHKDAAYHNGTIWNWISGAAIDALLQFGFVDNAWSLTNALVHQMNDRGSAGTLSENLDAFPEVSFEPRLTGTYSQAWSVAAFNQSFWRGYLGISPDHLSSAVKFAPQIPREMGPVDAIVPLSDRSLHIQARPRPSGWHYALRLQSADQAVGRSWTLVFVSSSPDGSAHQAVASLLPGVTTHITAIGDEISIDGARVHTNKVREGYLAALGPVQPLVPALDQSPMCLLERNFLMNVITEGGWQLPAPTTR